MTPTDAALIARSVLSCPSAITLRVDDASSSLEEEGYEVTTDVHGVPVFSAARGSALLAGAETGADHIADAPARAGGRSAVGLQR